MAYRKDDPRSVLTSSSASSVKASEPGFAAPGYYDFAITKADVVTAAGSEQWIVRGQNFVLIYTEPKGDDVIWKSSLASEQVVLLINEDSRVRGQDDSGADHDVSGPALVVVPPGQSTLTSIGDGPVVQLVQSDETEWAQRASNADTYAVPHPKVALLDPWPEPKDGYRWRTYRIADVPDEPKRFGRIFRTRAFMVNFIKPGNGPRDPRRMSPHYHDDFEQCSLVAAGEYIHHIQTPWESDSTTWRPEDHVRVSSPSVTIIPPPTVHTSQSIGRGVNHLIDIFAGPRHDFSAQPGWVLNADEYPAPRD